MEKHELELVTSTCTMSYNVLLHDDTRHIHNRLTLKGGTDHSLQLTNFADADCANDNSTRKSRSSYLFTLGRGPTSHKSKKRTCVAQSTCEAEYHYAADTTKEGLHLHQFMGEIFDAPIT
jgi:hypothetical protein